MATTGERRINPTEAYTVRRIFEAFAGGISPRGIAAALNKDGLAGPSGKPWGASTIYGNWRRGTGVLNNELYIGRLIWNRQRFVKDPDTGRRQARMNPPEAWIIEDVPDLRILTDELWHEVKARQGATRKAVTEPGAIRSERARRPRYLFSGVLTCGICGGGYTLVGGQHYGCASTRNRGTCDNRLIIRRDVLEETVLSGLRENLLHPDLVAEFIEEFRRETDRLQKRDRAAASSRRKELAKVERQAQRIVEAIKDGLYVPAMKAEMAELEARRAELEAALAAAPAEPPALHPGLAELYRRKVADLTASLADPDLRTEAAEALRALIEEIRLTPQDGVLTIELVGQLAGILALGNAKSPRALNVGAHSVILVAGVGFEPTTFRL